MIFATPRTSTCAGTARDSPASQSLCLAAAGGRSLLALWPGSVCLIAAAEERCSCQFLHNKAHRRGCVSRVCCTTMTISTSPLHWVPTPQRLEPALDGSTHLPCSLGSSAPFVPHSGPLSCIAQNEAAWRSTGSGAKGRVPAKPCQQPWMLPFLPLLPSTLPLHFNPTFCTCGCLGAPSPWQSCPALGMWLGCATGQSQRSLRPPDRPCRPHQPL